MKKITVFKLGTEMRPVDQADIDLFTVLLKESKSDFLRYFNFVEFFNSNSNYDIKIEEIEIFEDSFLIVRCGTHIKPPSLECINWINEAITELFDYDDKSVGLVTHHAIEFMVKNTSCMSEFSSLGIKDSDKFVVLGP